jgi:hypothetical protein
MIGNRVLPLFRVMTTPDRADTHLVCPKCLSLDKRTSSAVVLGPVFALEQEQRCELCGLTVSLTVN